MRRALLALAVLATTLITFVGSPAAQADPWVEYRDPNPAWNPQTDIAVCRDVNPTVPVASGGPTCGTVVSVDPAAASLDAMDQYALGDPAGARAAVAALGNRALAADVYSPPGTGARPVVLLFHGGGFAGGSKRDVEATARDLSVRGYKVIAFDYRLAALSRFFDVVEDADGNPSTEPTWCAPRAPLPGERPGTYLQSCFGTVISQLSTCLDEGGCVTARRAFLIGRRYAHDDGAAFVSWTKGSAAPLGIDPAKVLVSGFSAGSILASDLSYQLFQNSNNATRVLAGASIGGIALDTPAKLSLAATEMGSAGEPVPPTGSVDASDPPYLELHYEADPINPVATSITSMHAARAAGANLKVALLSGAQGWFPFNGTTWPVTCGQGHDTWDVDVARGRDRIATFFWSAVTGAPEPGDVALGPKSTSTSLPLSSGVQQMARGPRTPVVADFNGDQVDDVFLIGAGTACDSLWLGSTDGVFAPVPTPLVQSNGPLPPLVGDFYKPTGEDVPRAELLFTYDKNFWLPGWDDVLYFPPGATTPSSHAEFNDDEVPFGARMVAGDFGRSSPGAVSGSDVVVVDALETSDEVLVQWGADWTRTTRSLGNVITDAADLYPQVADFNGDGWDDIVWYKAGSTTDNVWSGREVPLANPSPPKPVENLFTLTSANLGSAVRQVLIGNFGRGSNESGDPANRARDLYQFDTPGAPPWGGLDSLQYGSPSSGFRYLFLWGGFVPTDPAKAWGAVGDLNGDGWDDIVWYGEGSGVDRIFFGGANPGLSVNAFSAITSYSLGGNRRPVVGRFDGTAGADVLFLEAS